MTKQELFEIKVNSISKEIYDEAKKQWDSLSKPLDGMGDFEEIICQIAAISGEVYPDIAQRVLMVFCADNGIVAEHISQSGQDITRKVAYALGQNRSAACCLAKSVNTKVLPVDMGINCDEKIEGVLDRKIAMGTKDFLINPSMTEEQVLCAIATGIELVKEAVENGEKLIATGEMGIGNTTTSTAVLCAVLDIDSDIITGKGSGLKEDSLKHKKEVIKEGIKKYRNVYNKEVEQERCFEILRCLGGLDIAAMCGTFIGGAMYGVPVVIDGLISSVAALLANRLVNGTNQYMIASHSGKEQGTAYALEALGLKAVLKGNMALGEGTGALMAIPLIDSALYLYRNGTRFESNGIENYERYN